MGPTAWGGRTRGRRHLCRCGSQRRGGELLYQCRELGIGAGGYFSVDEGGKQDVVLALSKMQPVATCRTCCLEGTIDKPKCVKKSMPSKGVATAASRKSKAKFWSEKQTVKRRKPQDGMVFPLAPTRYRPVGGAVSACSKTDLEAHASTKNRKLLCVSCS